MHFLLRFVKLCAAFIKIPVRVSARSFLATVCLSGMTSLTSSLAAVHIAAFVRVLQWASICKDFPLLSQKSHCRLNRVNYNQAIIFSMSLLNILRMDSERLWHSYFPPDISHALPLTDKPSVYKIVYSQPASTKIDFGTGMALSVVPKPTRPH